MPKHEVASCMKLGCAAYDKLVERIEELEAENERLKGTCMCMDCGKIIKKET